MNIPRGITGYITVLWLLSAAAGSGQNLVFDHFTIDQGLSNNATNCLLQDTRGFIWIGTRNGLNKYNGYEFEVYVNRQEDSSSISNNNILDIEESPTGEIWLGTNGGLNCFDPRTETFRHYLHDPSNPNSLSDNRVRTVHIDESGVVWAGTRNGLERLDPVTGQVKRFPIDEPGTEIDWFEISEINQVKDSPSAPLIVGTWGAGIYAFDRQSGQYSLLEIEGLPLPVWINDLFLSPSGELWGAFSNVNLFRLNPDEDRFEMIDVIREEEVEYLNDIHAIHVTPENKIYSGLGGNGIRFCTSEGQEELNSKVHPNSQDLYDNWVVDLLVDQEGGLWIAKMGNGVSRYVPKKQMFSVYRHFSDDAASLSNNVITGLLITRKGDLWVGTRRHGINVLEKDSTRFVRLNSENGKLPYDEVLALHQDRNGYIWIGTWGSGALVYDPSKKTVISFLANDNREDAIVSNFIRNFCETSSGELWMASPDGVSVIDLSNWQAGRFRNYYHDPADPKSLSAPRADVIYQDHSDNIWLGTSGGGLNLYDPTVDGFIHYKHDPFDPMTLSNNRVLSIFEDSREQLWVGAFGGGLNLLDRTNGTFQHFNTKDGLPSDEIVGICEDDRGNLWIGTGQGLSRFDMDEGAFTNFNEEDGLAGNVIVYGSSVVKDERGYIYCGSTTGLSGFHPDSLQQSDFVPPLVFSSILRHNSTEAPLEKSGESSINGESHITLPYQEKIVTLKFAALSYDDPLKNQYAYRMEGFNSDWIFLGNKREVTFTSLEPGLYTLQVMGSNSDGVWNEEGNSLQIEVLPPWWLSTWATLLWSFLLAAGLVLLSISLANRSNRIRESQRLKDLNEAKSAFLSAVSHELRTPLTSIMGFSMIIKKRLQDRILPNTNLENPRNRRAADQVMDNIDIVVSESERLTQLINEVLDLSKIEAGKITWNMDLQEISSVMDQAVGATSTLFSAKHLKLKVDCPRGLPLFKGDRNRVVQVLINLLSNAAKFSDQGVVTCRVQLVENDLQVEISDQGKGIEEKDLDRIFGKFSQVDDQNIDNKPQGTGLGLAISKEIIEYHGGEIWVKSHPGKGSTFFFTLPVWEEKTDS